MNLLLSLGEHDLLVLNHGYLYDDSIQKLLFKTDKPRVVVWSRNYYGCELEQIITKSKSIIRNVFVSKQQYDFYLPNKELMQKSTYIYHCSPHNINYKKNEYINNEFRIGFMGSISPAKNFHLLAKAWKNIKRKIPNAKLDVIGSGKLYDKDAKLGRYGIAESNYEKLFIQELLIDGKIDDDVIFHGTLNYQQRQNVLKNLDIGVINPTGNGETFCISALEFLNHNIPVVGPKDFSLPDLITHKKNGFLYKKPKYLAKTIIKAYDSIAANKFIFQTKDLKKFSVSQFEYNWLKLIKEIDNQEHNRIYFFSRPYFTKKKFYAIIRFFINRIFNINESIFCSISKKRHG